MRLSEPEFDAKSLGGGGFGQINGIRSVAGPMTEFSQYRREPRISLRKTVRDRPPATSLAFIRFFPTSHCMYRTPFPLTLAILLSACLLGCPAKPAKKPERPPLDDNVAPAQPTGETEPTAEPDDASGVEATGASVTKDSDGKIVAIDTRTAPGFGDEQLAMLTGFDRLSSLSLENSVVTDDGLAALKQIPTLKTLNLRKCAKLTDAGLEHVAELPKLERLILLYNKDGLTNECMESIAKISSLRALDIRGCVQIKDDGLLAMAPLKNLVDFKHRGFNVTNKGLAVFKELPQLRVLMMQDAANVDDGAMEHLAGLDGLTNLDMTGTSVEDPGLAALAGKKIKDLRLRNTLVEGTGLDQLEAAYETLTYLDLNESFATDEGLAQAASFKNLETLLVWQTDVTDEGLSVLSELPKLKKLMLKACSDVTDAGMPAVAKVESLVDLDLSETTVSDEGLKALHGLKNLTTLNVANTDVTEEGITAIQEAIPGLNNVTQ